MFLNRKQAGRLLASRVFERMRQRGDNPSEVVVVGLPRGGVPVAQQVAQELAAPLTILASKKIGMPGQPEFAIGAISSAGIVVLNSEILPLRGRWSEYIRSEHERLTKATKILENHWLSRAGLKQVNFHNRVVVLVDDGIATGMTVLAAAKSVRAALAKSVIIATPVVAAHAVDLLMEECDELVSIEVPTDLTAVGCFYRDFSATEECEVISILREAATRQRPAS